MKFKITSMVIAAMMIASGLIMFSPSQNTSIRVSNLTIAWPSNWAAGPYLNIWCGANNSEGTGVYALYNTTAAQGALYFQTNSFRPTNPPYGYSEMSNTANFPANSTFMLAVTNATEAGWHADRAVIDPRIEVLFWDDFRVGLESPANLSAVYNATHHEDGNIGHPLDLFLVVYTNGWYFQTVYTWAQLAPWFDGVLFFHAADSYDTTLPQFLGYEDAIREFHARMPDKRIWIGLYLHHYQLTTAFPNEMTTDQLNIGGELIKEGIAECFTLHVIYWLPVHPDVAAMIRDYILNEVAQDYRTTIVGIIITTTNGLGNVVIPAITGLATRAQWYTFNSTHLQNVSVQAYGFTSPKVQMVRTGAFIPVIQVGSNFTFVTRANEEYRFMNLSLTTSTISTKTYIETPTTWNKKNVTLHAQLYLNSTLTIRDSIVRIGTYQYRSSIRNGTNPVYGITWNGTYNTGTQSRLFVFNSTIMPEDRCFTYYLNESGHSSTVVMNNATIVGFAGFFEMRGYVYINDSYFYQAGQPNGDSSWGLELYSQSDTQYMFFQRNHIWNYWSSGHQSVYLALGGLTYYYYLDRIHIDNNMVIGGRYGLNIDMAYVNNLTLLNWFMTSSTNLPLTSYSEVVIAGGATGDHVGKYVAFNYSYPNGARTGLRIQTNGILFMNITSYEPTLAGPLMVWTADWVDEAAPVIFTVTGFRSDVTYRFLRDTDAIQTGIVGPIFVVATTGNHYYYLGAWFETRISNIVILIFDMFVIGILFGVIGAAIAPFRTKKEMSREKMLKHLLNMFIYIVIACAMIGVLYAVIYG